MYDVNLFDGLEVMIGGTFQKSITNEMIDKLEKHLNVKLPEDYKFFLKSLGEGAIKDAPYTFGIDNKGNESVLIETEKLRKKFGITENYVVLNLDMDSKIARCLETKSVYCEHCKVCEVNLETKESIQIAESFDEYFNNILKKICENFKIPLGIFNDKETEESSLYIISETGLHTVQNGMVKSLPKGVGFKTGWLVIQDANVKLEDIVKKFNYMTKETETYENGVQRARDDSKIICISDLGKGQIYLFEHIAWHFSNHEDELEKFCEGLEKVFLFYTYRVSEAHGFAVVENGRLKRSYYFDENRIYSSGEPLEEEVKLGLQFPDDFYEMSENQDNSKITIINEDIIVNLAMELTGRKGAFDYEDAVLLKVGLLR